MTNNLGADSLSASPSKSSSSSGVRLLAEQPDGRKFQGCTRGQRAAAGHDWSLKFMTGKPRPIHRIFPFLDALFRSSPMVVEMDDVLRSPAEVGDDEPDSREELATMPFNFLRLPGAHEFHTAAW